MNYTTLIFPSKIEFDNYILDDDYGLLTEKLYICFAVDIKLEDMENLKF